MKFVRPGLCFLISLLSFCTLFSSRTEARFFADSTSLLIPQDYFREEEQLVNTVLTRYHFKKFNLNDSLSSAIFDRYIKSLDFNKLYFLQLYLNAYTETIDPHSNYLLPITSENFKIDMTRALEGIGAQLQAEDEYTKVVEIITGGPAFKSNLLHRDDRIVGVAQGDDGEMVDVVGWRVNDVVKLIRGPKESVVRLLILQASEGANALPKEIRLVRDKVKLEDQSAKKQILELINNNVPYRVGVISVPAFY